MPPDLKRWYRTQFKMIRTCPADAGHSKDLETVVSRLALL